MIVVFIPTYHNITCMCVPLVRGLSYLIALLRFALTFQHAQSLFFVVSVLTFEGLVDRLRP